MLTGKALIAAIDSAAVPAGELALWWLGQHSFVVKAGKRVIYIDPFLSPRPDRLVPPLLAPDQVTNADLILGTHDHLDHIDHYAWPALAQSSPQATFVLADLLVGRVAAATGVPRERMVGLDDGASAELDGVRLTGVAAAHEFLDQDPLTGRYPHLGYVVEANGCTLYHSGDCCIYEGLHARLRRWQHDAMCLPINGRDAARLASGCIGNMTYQEAADLAGALRPGLVIAAHWDMFANNSLDPHLWAEYMRVKYPNQPALVPEHGVEHRIRRLE